MIRVIHGSLEGVESTRDRVVSVGSFDGVHLGHGAIVEQMVRWGGGLGLRPLIATFDPHPRTILAGLPERRLTTLDERSALLMERGVDTFVCLSFSESMSRMEPEVFVEDVLIKRLGAKAIVLGHDHRFGKDRAGDADLLAAMSTTHDFDWMDLGPVHLDGGVVSSSRIRTLLDEGNVSFAATLLDRFHAVSGTVVRGAGRGRTIGVPTANLVPGDGRKIIPARGVYAVRVMLPDEEVARMGMMNIGHRPTFDGDGLHLEVNVLDWSGDLYGRELRVEFVERVRDERKFDGVDALVEQLNADRDRCRALLSKVV